MRAARLHGPGDLRLSDEPAPQVRPGHELVRVTAVGICGSDLHWFLEGGIGDARLERPIVPGHELAGVIEGSNLDGVRVAIDPAIPCGVCPTCHAGDGNLCPTVGFAGHDRDGGLQEQLAWPRELLHPLPDSLSDADGAMLEPLGVAIHAVDLAHLRLGVRVLVVGCGALGLLIVQLAQVAGAAEVVAVEPLEVRRRAALRYGAERAVSDAAELADDAGGDRGFDVGFEVTNDGTAAQTAMVLARPGSRIVLVGIPDDDRTTFRASLARRKGLTLVLSRRMHDTYERAVDMVVSGRVDVSSLVTARYGLDLAVDAFRAAATRDGIKTVVHPTGEGDP